jgi:hypothetical protein
MVDFLEGDPEEQANLPPCSKEHIVENAKSSEKKISNKFILGEIGTPTFCVRFDYNDKYIAGSRGDGSI